MEKSDESDAKMRLMEAELEEKRREQERKHEERMMMMMMGFMQQMKGFSPALPYSQTQPPYPSFPPASPFPYPSLLTLLSLCPIQLSQPHIITMIWMMTMCNNVIIVMPICNNSIHLVTKMMLCTLKCYIIAFRMLAPSS